jgi:hypothetical protein
MCDPRIVERLARAVAHRVRPRPAPMHLLEWAATITVPDGDNKGEQLAPRKHAPQCMALRAIGDALLGRGRFRAFVIIKPTQDGGTLICITLPQVYTAAVLGDPVVSGHPDMRLAGVHWRRKFRPVVIAANATWLPATGPGSEGASTPDEVLINGTPCYWIGGGASNEAGQASLTGRLLTRDERDSMERYVAELMRGRIDSYRKTNRAVQIDTSTIKDDEHSAILGDMKESTAGRPGFACPRCGAFQIWEWEQVEFSRDSDRAARATVIIRCVACKEGITDADRAGDALSIENARYVMRGQTLQRDGQVVGPEPDTLSWGLTWTALDSSRISLASLAEEYFKAEVELRNGDPDRMRRFHRDRLCRVYKDSSKPLILSAAWLERLSAAAEYTFGVVPAGVEFLVLTVDVQLRWHYWWVEGFDRNLRRWVIAADTVTLVDDEGASFPGDVEPDAFARARAMQVIEDIADGGYPRQGSPDEIVPVGIRGVDVGFRQDDLREHWLRDRPHWNAVKGLSDDDSDEPSTRAAGDRLDGGRGRWHEVRRQRDRFGEWDLWFMDGDRIKPVVQGGYLLPEGPRAARLPVGLKANSAVIRHLVSERQIEFRGRKVYRQITSNAANHYLDCSVYALGLARAHVDTLKPVDVLDVRTDAAAPPPTISSPTPPPVPSHHDDRPRGAIALNRRSSRIARRTFR